MHKTEVSASDIGIIASKWNVKTQKQTFQSSIALQPICTQLPFLRQSDEGNTGTYNSNFGARKSFSKMPSYTYGIFVVNKHERPNIGPSRQAYFEKNPYFINSSKCGL